MALSRRGDRTPERIAFGAALRLLRSKIGWSQQKVAAAADITKAMLSSYEKGNSYPAIQTLFSLLRALGADFCDLQNSIDIFTGPEGAKISGGAGELASSRSNQLQREQEIGKAVLAIAAILRAKGEL